MKIPTEAQIAEAMQDAWNEFCSDAQAHPDCFYREGKKLFADFGRGNYARMVAEHLRFIMSRDGQTKANEDTIESLSHRLEMATSTIWCLAYQAGGKVEVLAETYMMGLKYGMTLQEGSSPNFMKKIILATKGGE